MGTIVRIAGAAALVAAALLVGFASSFRYRWAQGAIRRFNRSVTNPRELRTAGRPGARTSVVRHVGRRSGTGYATPVTAVPIDDGFLFALPYGPGADWVRNVLAAGTATLEHDGRVLRVDRPQLVPADEADPRFGPGQRWLHRAFGVRDFLRVRSAGAAGRPTPGEG